MYILNRLTNSTQRMSEGACRAFLSVPAPAVKLSACPCSLGQVTADKRFIFDANIANQACYRSKFLREGFSRRCCYSLSKPGYGAYQQGLGNFNAGYIARVFNGLLDGSGHQYCCNQQTPAELCLRFFNAYSSGKCQAEPRLSKFNSI